MIDEIDLTGMKDELMMVRHKSIECELASLDAKRTDLLTELHAIELEGQRRNRVVDIQLFSK